MSVTAVSIVGSIVPVGISTARWMFVTKATDDTVKGRMWSANSGKWTKTSAATYSRNAVGRKQPRCAKPSKPKDYV